MHLSKKKDEKPKSRYLASVGGQALMEGIMMNGPKGAAMALRLPDGSIEVTPKHPKKLITNRFFLINEKFFNPLYVVFYFENQLTYRLIWYKICFGEFETFLT